MSTEELMIDFYSGGPMLEIAAKWAYMVANRQMVLEQLLSFEKAYERLIELHAEGKLGVGAADFSAENLAVVKRINRLLQSGQDSVEARQSAEEVHALAEQCLQALTRRDASPVE
jgi:hypothetical protein